MFRWLLGLIVVAVLVFCGLYIAAGRGAPPALAITRPDRFVGQTGELEVTADAPKAKFTALSVSLEQNGRSLPLFALGGPGSPSSTSSPSNNAATVTPVDANRLKITRPIGKRDLADLQAGAARIVVTATRPGLLNLRQLTSTTSKDFQVRLEPPWLT